MCLAVWAQQAFGCGRRFERLGTPASIWVPESRIPGPGCPADGYKMVLCLCPAKAAHNCYPIWSLLAGGPRNSNLCPQQSRKMSMARSKKQQFMSTAIQKNAHGEVRGIAIYMYVHSNPENCPRRGPSNSNLCPQQSRKMSMARSEEQQFIQQSRKNYPWRRSRWRAK